jgi:hypothetical protein
MYFPVALLRRVAFYVGVACGVPTFDGASVLARPRSRAVFRVLQKHPWS